MKQRFSTESPDMPKHWLVLRLSALGDVVLTTGVLAYWERRFALRFSVLTKETFAPVFAGHPAVDQVLGLDAAALRPAALFPWFRNLAEQHGDWGLVDLHGTLRSRLLSALWKGPVLRYPKYSIARRSFLASRGKFGRDRLLSASVTQRYALAMEESPPPAKELIPRIYLTASERAAGAARVNALGLPSGKRVVALHPYATYARKAWPVEHWRALAALLDKAGVSWVVVGRGQPLFPGDGRDLTNGSGLRESCAILAACSVLITGDSGPMHLAAAVDTPVLALFGPTTQEWGFFPAGAHDVVLQRELACRPCSLHGDKACPREGECLRSIEPLDVLAQVLATIQRPGRM